jgi:photosystem II stability/assembly factor-like uncharacterized protein
MSLHGPSDAFVTKLGADGATLLYSTLLGGSGSETALGIALDAGGNAYVTGSTNSNDFPIRAAFQPKLGGHSDAFVTKYSPNGTLVFSTYLGGGTDDAGQAITVDSAGSAYVTGYTYSIDWPVVNAAKQYPPGGGDAFIAKFTPDGGSLVWSTYLGGTGRDFGMGISVDNSGDVYVAGTTFSRDFPTINAFQKASANPLVRKSVDGAATFVNSDAGLPDFGYVALAVDPTNASIVYAGSFDAVFKSSDSGATWAKVFSTTGYIQKLAIDPGSTSTVYAGTIGSIFKTTDGGATWNEIKYGGATVQALAVDPKKSAIVYAGSGGGQQLDGLYKSTDGGQTWTRPSATASGAQKAVKALAIDPSNNSTLYADIGNNLYKSTDGGVNWTLKFRSNSSVYDLVIDPSNPAVVYFVTYDNGPEIMKSTDGGESWHDSGFSFASLPGATVSNRSIYSLIGDPANPGTLYASTGAGLVKTTDGFDHWLVVNPSNGIYEIAVSASSPGTLYATSLQPQSDAFVARLNADGQSYSYVTYLSGSGTNSVASMALDGNGNVYVGGSTSASDFPMQNAFVAARSAYQDGYVAKIAADGSGLVYSSYVGAPVTAVSLGADGALRMTGSWNRPDFFTDQPLSQYRAHTLFQTKDSGGTWTGSSLPGGLVNSIFVVDPATPDRMYSSGNYMGVFVSVDAGMTWSLLKDAPPLRELVINPQTPSMMWGVSFNGQPGSGAIVKSTDGGQTWHVTQGSPTTRPSAGRLVVDPQNPTILYVGDFNTVNSASVYKSIDAGETWAPIATSPTLSFTLVPPALTGASFLTVDSQSVVYAVIGSGNTLVYKSADYGVTWTQLRNAPSASGIFVDPGNTSMLYYQTPGGIFRSTDGGASNTKIFDGLVLAFTIDPASPATLYLAPAAGGVLKSTDRGATWHTTGLNIPIVIRMAVDPSTPGRVYTQISGDPADVFVVKVVE